MLYFFLSHAHGASLDEDVRRFFDDLSEELRLFTGEPRDAQVGFVDVRANAGSPWSDQVTDALSACQTFVALCSPGYFRRSACGKEWSVFADRLGEYRRSSGNSAAALVPILWEPTALPDVARVGLNIYQRFGSAYPKGGLRALAGLSRHRDDYIEAVTAVAQHIAGTVRLHRLPAATRPPRFADVPNAFEAASEATGGRLKPPPPASDEAPGDVNAVVRAAFAAAGRPLYPTELEELLTPGPVWISTSAAPTVQELARFRDQIPFGRVGYFVHAGELSRDTEVVLDKLRVGGWPIVSVPLRELRAALVDGRAGFFLNELDRGYGSRDNLFDTKNALTDGRFLFGRDAILNTVGSIIRRGEHILITGLRKVGKTSVLNVLRQHLVDQPVCMVDMQRFDRHNEDWPGTLFQLMIGAFDRWGRAEREDWDFRNPLPTTVTELEHELDARLAHPLAPSRLIVILDELERVFPVRGESEPAQRWVRATGALRVLSQGERRRVAVIGADLRPDATRGNDLGAAGTNPFFNLLQEMPLPLLGQQALTEMTHSLGGAMGVDTVTPTYVERLFELTGGHPSLARTIAGESYRVRRVPSRLGDTDLRTALDRLEADDAIGYFLRNNLWQLMTFSEREVMAKRVGGHDSAVTSRDLGQAEATLRAQGLLQDGRIRIGLLERWIREHARDG